MPTTWAIAAPVMAAARAIELVGFATVAAGFLAAGMGARRAAALSPSSRIVRAAPASPKPQG
jgi:hypothetical protein